MREIKFRAWDKERKRWLDGLTQFPLNFKETEKVLLENTEWATYSQYTGLKDKNGKEIYEGDLLKNTLIKPQIIECFCADEIIGSAGYAFKFRKLPNDKNMMWRWETTDIEVVGNIYENPELLT